MVKTYNVQGLCGSLADKRLRNDRNICRHGERLELMMLKMRALGFGSASESQSRGGGIQCSCKYTEQPRTMYASMRLSLLL